MLGNFFSCEYELFLPKIVILLIKKVREQMGRAVMLDN